MDVLTPGAGVDAILKTFTKAADKNLSFR